MKNLYQGKLAEIHFFLLEKKIHDARKPREPNWRALDLMQNHF